MSWLADVRRYWLARSLSRPDLASLFEPPESEAWVAIDCEMTGLNPKKNHLLSVAAIHINQQRIDLGSGLHLLCRSPVMPKQDTVVIHGIRPQDVAIGMAYEAMLDRLLPFIGNRVIVGFCPQLDLAFLNPLVKHHIGTVLPNQVVDIGALYQKKTGNRTEGVQSASQHLTQILRAYDLPNLGQHDAFNDALMTAMAFLCLKGR